jgi:hypothetical protein
LSKAVLWANLYRLFIKDEAVADECRYRQPDSRCPGWQVSLATVA